MQEFVAGSSLLQQYILYYYGSHTQTAQECTASCQQSKIAVIPVYSNGSNAEFYIVIDD